MQKFHRNRRDIPNGVELSIYNQKKSAISWMKSEMFNFQGMNFTFFYCVIADRLQIVEQNFVEIFNIISIFI